MNVSGRFRSNHFVVKDQAAFAQWCQKYGLHLLVSESHPALVGFLNDKRNPPQAVVTLIQADRRVSSLA